MFKAIQTSVSGLIASTTRLNVAASNIVNSQVKSTPGDSNGFAPRHVEQTSTGSGGVRAAVVITSPSSLAIFDPASPLANDEGQVNIPNVSLPAEIGEITRASQAYKANANVLKALDENLKILLSI